MGLIAAAGVASAIVARTAANDAVLDVRSRAAFLGMNVIVPADGMASEAPCSEQCRAWHFAIAPGVPARATPTGLDAIRY